MLPTRFQSSVNLRPGAGPNVLGETVKEVEQFACLYLVDDRNRSREFQLSHFHWFKCFVEDGFEQALTGPVAGSEAGFKPIA